jgi:nucleotide-binding universal stress UspA family protein
MVHVDVDSELSARVGIAADLADRFQSQLIGVAGLAPMSMALADEVTLKTRPSVPELDRMQKILDLKGKQFFAEAGKNGRQVEWRSALEFPTEMLTREAREADLVVVGNKPENPDPFQALDPGGVLLKAGRPVLVVPASVTALSPKRIAIAWKDVREARRAVRDALPFLQLAEKVTVIEISEKGAVHQVADLKGIASYLARHRITGVEERVQAPLGTVAESLLQMVRDERFDLIVAGGYGHSRLGEWVFGGVTRHLLAQSSVSCVFSH